MSNSIEATLPSPESGKEANAMQKMLEAKIASNEASDLIPETWVNVDEAQKEAYRIKVLAKMKMGLSDLLEESEPSAEMYESVANNPNNQWLVSPKEIENALDKGLEKEGEPEKALLKDFVRPFYALSAAYVELGARVLAWRDNRDLGKREKAKNKK